MRMIKNVCMFVLAATCLFAKEEAMCNKQAAVSGLEYFDLGAWETWNFMDWSKGEVNVTALDTYIDSFCTQLKAQSVSSVMLSFGQAADIIAISEEKYSDLSLADAIGMLYKNTGGKLINDGQVINYIVARFKKNEVTVGMSFGGQSAQNSDWDFGFDTNDPSDLAIALAGWAEKVGFDNLDFDVESTAFSSNDPQKLYMFFNGLQEAFTATAITFTVMGDTNYWGVDGSAFGAMFKDTGLQYMFSGINLMLYNGQYYLNAGQTPTQSWDLFLWMTQLKENMKLSFADVAKYINVGFNSKLDYTLASTSSGPLPYSSLPSDISSGEAAAFIYKDLEKSLSTLAGEEITLGTPFFWDDNADYTVSAANKYESQFFVSTDNFEKEFYEILQEE